MVTATALSEGLESSLGDDGVAGGGPVHGGGRARICR